MPGNWPSLPAFRPGNGPNFGHASPPMSRIPSDTLETNPFFTDDVKEGRFNPPVAGIARTGAWGSGGNGCRVSAARHAGTWRCRRSCNPASAPGFGVLLVHGLRSGGNGSSSPALRRHRSARTAARSDALALTPSTASTSRNTRHGRLADGEELSGVSFAFIKATEGGDRVDDKFAEHWRGTRAAGIPRAAYHFYYFCRTGRRAGRLVHPQRAEGALGAAAGARHGMEPAVADLQAAARRGDRAQRDAHLPAIGREALRQEADHLHVDRFLRRQPARRLQRLSLLAALGRRPPVDTLRQPSASPSGSIPAPASCPASRATPTSTSSTAATSTWQKWVARQHATERCSAARLLRPCACALFDRVLLPPSDEARPGSVLSRRQPDAAMFSLSADAALASAPCCAHGAAEGTLRRRFRALARRRVRPKPVAAGVGADGLAALDSASIDKKVLQRDRAPGRVLARPSSNFPAA